jgi:hypothetical protein
MSLIASMSLNADYLGPGALRCFSAVATMSRYRLEVEVGAILATADPVAHISKYGQSMQFGMNCSLTGENKLNVSEFLR